MSPNRKKGANLTVSRRKSQTLSFRRKRLIMDYKNQSLENGTCQNSNLKNLLMSNKWIKDLHNFLIAKDSKISLSDVHRWIDNHSWIREIKGKPKNMGKQPTIPQNTNDYQDIQVQVDNNSVDVTTHPNDVGMTTHKPVQIGDKYPRKTKSSPGRRCDAQQNSGLVRQNSNDSEVMPILSPQGLPYTNGSIGASSQTETRNRNGDVVDNASSIPHRYTPIRVPVSSVPKKRLAFRESVQSCGEGSNTNHENQNTEICPEVDDEENTINVQRTHSATNGHELTIIQEMNESIRDDVQVENSTLNQNCSWDATSAFNNDTAHNVDFIQEMETSVPIQDGEHVIRWKSNTCDEQSNYPGSENLNETRIHYQGHRRNASNSSKNVTSSSSTSQVLRLESIMHIKQLQDIFEHTKTTAFCAHRRGTQHLAVYDNPTNMDFHAKLILHGLATVCKDYTLALLDQDHMLEVILKCKRIYKRIMRKFLLPVNHPAAVKKCMLSVKQEPKNDHLYQFSEDDYDSQDNSDYETMNESTSDTNSVQQQYLDAGGETPQHGLIGGSPSNVFAKSPKAPQV